MLVFFSLNVAFVPIFSINYPKLFSSKKEVSSQVTSFVFTMILNELKYYYYNNKKNFERILFYLPKLISKNKQNYKNFLHHRILNNFLHHIMRNFALEQVKEILIGFLRYLLKYFFTYINQIEFSLLNTLI